MPDQSDDFDSEATYGFPIDGRDKWVPILQQYGYVELEGYQATNKNYCCANCPGMLNDQSGAAGSPTGWWCKIIKAPDRPNGCCDGWRPLNDASPKPKGGEPS